MRIWLVLLTAGTLMDTAALLALPAVLGRVVDAVVGGRPDWAWVAAAGGLMALGVVGDLIGALASTAYGAGAAADLRRRLVRHVLSAGPDARLGGRLGIGDLVARVSANAADAVQSAPAVVLVATAVLAPVGSLALLTAIDPWLALAFVAGLALVALVLRAFTRRTSTVVADYQRTQGLLAARLAESLAGARTVHAAATAAVEERRVLEPLRDLRRYGDRLWRVAARSSAQAAVVGPLVLVAVLVAGGLALTAGRISAGELLAASRYAVVGAGLGGLTAALGRLARARAARGRVREVLALPPVAYGTASLPPGGRGHLELRGVIVRDGDRVLLDEVDLTVPGGSSVAVVGRSGAGKSVLAAVAARLRAPDAGVVRLDGVPVSHLTHDAVRTAVGCAFERPVLVGQTIGDAIGLGLDATAVRAAAVATRAHDYVSRLPRGYDTPLAEAPMSGGEAQRLGLARAWPAERLLVLDDATSSLDVVTELRVAEALAADAGRRARLIVTHRATTAARADQVVWLDGGRVRAVGPHRLLWSDPAYQAVFS